MTVSLDDRVRNLCESAETLNSVADRITKHITRIENDLRKSGIGVPHTSKESFYSRAINVHYDEHGQFLDCDCVDYHLGWLNGQDGWGFYWGQSIGERSEVPTFRLINAPRYIRVPAYAKLDTLLVELSEAVFEETEELAKITASIPSGDGEEARL